MAFNWKQWCRVCGNENAGHLLESFEEIKQIIEAQFHISLQDFNSINKCICDECYNFVTKLERFKERVLQASKMFAELSATKPHKLMENDILDCRNRFLSDSLFVEVEAYNENEISIKTEISFSDEENTTEENEQEQSTSLMPKDMINVDEPELHLEHYTNNRQSETDELSKFKLKLSLKGPQKQKTKSERKSSGTKKNAENPQVKCDPCDRSFCTRLLYLNHLQSKHPHSEELLYPCSVCPKRFPSDNKARRHEIIHLPSDQKFIHPCPYCDKKFSFRPNVKSHIRIVHVGERPFVCEECGKTCSTKGSLQQHQKVHDGTKPFQCSYCPKRFSNTRHMKDHEDTHSDTQYGCPHCGLQLNTKKTLKMHMVVHSDQKKFKCQYCGNEYKRSKTLKSHLILHTGTRPFQCPFCDKTFSNGSNCRSHKKKSHPEELAALEASQSHTTNKVYAEQKLLK